MKTFSPSALHQPSPSPTAQQFLSEDELRVLSAEQYLPPTPPLPSSIPQHYEVILVLDRVCDLLNHRALYQLAFSYGITNIWAVLNPLPAKNRSIQLEKFHSSDFYTNTHYFDTSSSCVEALQEEGYDIWVSTLSPIAQSLHLDNFSTAVSLSERYLSAPTSLQFHDFRSELSELMLSVPKRIAIVLGRETDGISQPMIVGATKHVFLPMYGFAESFNVGVAGALLIHRIMTLIQFQRDFEAKARLVNIPSPFDNDQGGICGDETNTPYCVQMNQINFSIINKARPSYILTQSQQCKQWLATRQNILSIQQNRPQSLNDHFLVSAALWALQNGATSSLNDDASTSLLQSLGFYEAKLKPLHEQLMKDQLALGKVVGGCYPGITPMLVPKSLLADVDEENEDAELPSQEPQQQKGKKAKKGVTAPTPESATSQSTLVIKGAKCKDTQGEQCCYYGNNDETEQSDIESDTFFESFQHIKHHYLSTPPSSSLPMRRTASQMDQPYTSITTPNVFPTFNMPSFDDCSNFSDHQSTLQLSPLNLLIRWLALSELREIVLNAPLPTTSNPPPSSPHCQFPTPQPIIDQSLETKSQFHTKPPILAKFISSLQLVQTVLHAVDHFQSHPTSHITIDFANAMTNIRFGELHFLSIIISSFNASSIRWLRGSVASDTSLLNLSIPIRTFLGKVQQLVMKYDNPDKYAQITPLLQLSWEWDKYNDQLKVYNESIKSSKKQSPNHPTQLPPTPPSPPSQQLSDQDKLILRNNFNKNIKYGFDDRESSSALLSRLQSLYTASPSSPQFITELQPIIDEFRPQLSQILSKYGNGDFSLSTLSSLNTSPPTSPPTPTTSLWDSKYSISTRSQYSAPFLSDFTPRFTDLIPIPIAKLVAQCFTSQVTIRELLLQGSFAGVTPTLAGFALNLMDGAETYRYIPHYLNLHLNAHEHSQQQEPCLSCMSLTTPICNLCAKRLLFSLLQFIFAPPSSQTPSQHQLSIPFITAIHQTLQTIITNNSQESSLQTSSPLSVLSSHALLMSVDIQQFMTTHSKDLSQHISHRIANRFFSLSPRPSPPHSSTKQYIHQLLTALISPRTSPPSAEMTSKIEQISHHHINPTDFPTRLVDHQRYPIVQSQTNISNYSATLSLNIVLRSWLLFFTGHLTIPSRHQRPNIYSDLSSNPDWARDRSSQLSLFTSFSNDIPQCVDDLLSTGKCTYTAVSNSQDESDGSDSVVIEVTLKEIIALGRQMLFTPLIEQSPHTLKQSSTHQQQYQLHPTILATFFVDVSFVVYIRRLFAKLQQLLLPITQPTLIVSTAPRYDANTPSQFILEIFLETFIRFAYATIPIPHQRQVFSQLYAQTTYVFTTTEPQIHTELISNNLLNETLQTELSLLIQPPITPSTPTHLYSPFTTSTLLYASRIDHNPGFVASLKQHLCTHHFDTNTSCQPSSNRPQDDSTHITIPGRPYLCQVNDDGLILLLPPTPSQSLRSVPIAHGALAQLM